MNKIATLLFASLLMTASLAAQGQRFIDEVFTSVDKLEDQIYSVNITVVTGAPTADTLLFDLYMPAGDTCSSRPLAVALHTGTFLPRGLFAPTGDKDDYANVQVCERLAKMGYVAASVQYRLGWNPISPQDTVRRSTIINAAYRSVQDLHAFLRFMNMTVDEFGNPFRIDPDRVALYGIGTGGFVGFNAAILTQDEVYIEKFTNPGGSPMIDTFLLGNLTGETPGLINIPNHVGYKQDFHFAYGLDGAVGDSSWMLNGPKVPFAVVGTVTHPTTPYGIDPITGMVNCDLPVYAGAGTGSFVVNIGGSICMIEKANELGFNDPLNKGTYNDPVSEQLRQSPYAFGQEHIWAIDLPGPQAGPWEYWDAAFWDQIPHPLGGGASVHQVALATNPDMSIEKANHYIDTSLWFFAPRAYVALNLNDWICSCANVQPDPQIIQDFECQRNFNFAAGSDRLMTVDNPETMGINTSAKAGMYSDPANDPWAALCVDFGGPVDLATYNQFSMQVRTGTAGPMLIKLEGGTSPAYEVWTETTGSGNWETVTANFASQGATDHTRLCIFPNGGVGQATEDVYLIDNLRMDPDLSGVFAPSVETLHISPNPASQMVYVRNTVGATQFRLVNTLGQVVLTQRAQGQDIVSLYIDALQTGIYLVSAFDESGRLLGNARILKN